MLRYTGPPTGRLSLSLFAELPLRDTRHSVLRLYECAGEQALVNRKPCPENPTIRVAAKIEEKVLYLGRNYHFGPPWIFWYLERCHGMKAPQGGVRGVLLRHGLNRLPRDLKKRSIACTRYEKQVPGHHVQVDVRFLYFNDKQGRRLRRFQYSAVDDATRVRALKIHRRHTRANALDFVDSVVNKFPFRINMICIDNGHEFQAKFHWHLKDLGIVHVYIKPGTPRLNGKIERFHRTDREEFYQLLT